MVSVPRTPLLRYGAAVALEAVALGLSLILPVAATPSILFFAAAVLSAAYGGLGPGLLATVLAIAAMDWFFLHPYEFTIATVDFLNLAVFAVAVVAISTLVAARRAAEQRTADSERQLQAILDNSSAVVYLKDTRFRYLLVNRRYEELFHLTREQARGKTSHDVFPRELADRFRDNDQRALAATGPLQFEEVVPQDDGLHTYITLKFPLRDARGRTYAVCGVSTDITERARAEAAVAEHRERLRVTLASIGDAVITTDAAGRITFMNGVAEQITGWRAAEAEGRPLAEVFRIVDEDTRATAESPVDKVLREGVVAALANHTVLLARDGREVPIDDSGAPILDGRGVVIGVVLVFRDVVERRRAERERARGRRQAEILAGVAAVINASTDVDTVLERVVEAARELCGSDAARIALWDAESEAMVIRYSVGGLRQTYVGERLRPGVGFAGLVMSSGRPVRSLDAQSDPRTSPVQLPIARDEGTRALMVVPIRIDDRVEGLIYASNRSTRPFDDHDEAIAVQLADQAAVALRTRQLFAREQAAREEAQAAARRAAFLAEASRVLSASLDYERTLETVAQQAVPFLADWCAVDVFDPDGRAVRLAVAHHDPACRPLLHELMKRYPVDLDNAAHPIARVLREGRPECVAEVTEDGLVAMARDAEHLTILRKLGVGSYLSVPLHARGRTLGAISFAFGTSGRRYGAAEQSIADDLARRAALAVDNARLFREAASANRTKDEFLATLSHELRTPLNAVLGWSRMLRSGTLDAPTAERAMEAIERNTRLQVQLIEDLLDVSRIITGKLRLDARPISLALPIDAAIDAVRMAAEAKGIAIRTVLDPDVGPVLGDPGRLQQVVWNLLTNAIKFTPRDGHVTVRLDRADGQAELRVSDTGRGITPDFLPFIFDRFRQADSTTTRHHGGLGLGLAIVRHLVEQHGGTVHAESPGEGKGATFTVRLPLLVMRLEAREAGPGGRLDAPVAALSSLAGVRVLVVDDEQDARDLVATVLQQCGADVTAAGSVQEAVKAFESARPDVVVSDIAMPGQDGYELMRWVRKLGGTGRDAVPAIALTAYAGESNAREARAAGYDLHLAKPVDPAALISAIASLARRDEAST